MRCNIFQQKMLAVAVLALSGFSAQAQGTKAAAWNGAWQSGKGAKPVIEVVVKDGTLAQLLVDGAVHEISDVEVSPDQKTVLFRSGMGQGTLLRVEDKAAEISLFSQKMKVQNVVIARK